MELVDMLFLITVSVYPCQWFIAVLVGIQIQALPFVCAAFLNHLHPVPQEGGAVAWLAVPVQPVFFDAPAEGIVDVAVELPWPNQTEEIKEVSYLVIKQKSNNKLGKY